eukprot:COSAG01_NODE_56725_length_316_cov_1.419355_2_plen_45_part_01
MVMLTLLIGGIIQLPAHARAPVWQPARPGAQLAGPRARADMTDSV